MEKLVTQFHWMKLSNEQRILMREKFNIPKSGGVVMQNNTMITDGSNENDLKAINTVSMQNFLLKEDPSTKYPLDTFEALYTKTIETIDNILASKEFNRQVELAAEKNAQRSDSIDSIVSSILTTIDNIPLDAKARIYTYLASELNTHVKEDNSTKEIEQGSDQQVAKGTGKGSRKTKSSS